MQLKWTLAGGVLLAAGAAAALLTFGAPPGWLTLLLGTIALALLYIAVRFNSRYDPLDARSAVAFLRRPDGRSRAPTPRHFGRRAVAGCW